MAHLEDDFSWEPPSESELKVIEARRERNNKVSSIMGQYLLKGYKMLAVTCPVCNCVLLEDRMQNKYCVGCQEVDADTKKDNPAVSEEAARKTVEEIQHRHTGEEEQSDPGDSQPTTSHTQPLATTTTTQTPPTSTSCRKNSPVKTLTVHGADLTLGLSEAAGALRDTLEWAALKLKNADNIQESQSLVGLITETCKAITALKGL